MRISDSLRYALFQANIKKVGDQLDTIEKKISTQKNINAPSDDPIKFATSIQYDAELSSGEQYNNNLQRLSTLVGMYGVSFDSIGSQLSNLANAANNYGQMDADLRMAAGEQIKATIEQFVTVGNTKLGSTYIFGGKQANSPPFQLNNDYSVTFNVSQSAEDATNIYVDTGQTGKFGISGREGFYDTSKIAFGNVSNTYAGDIYSNTDSFAYKIDGTNNTLRVSVNGIATAYTLTQGIYNGGTLAKEVQSKLGSDYSVAFDSTTRKFLITNNIGADATFNWSTSSAASVLGFDNKDAVVKTGQLVKSDVDTGRKAFLVEITAGGSTTGALGSRATYRYSVDGGVTWTAGVTANTGGADTTADIVIDDSNHTIYLNNAPVALANGSYTGNSLAAEIQNELGAGFTVNYDGSTRKFSITNSTGGVAILNWSNSNATAGGVLGFDNVDSVLSAGESDASDYDSGMFIDGAGVVTTTNNRMKLLFGTTGNLVAGATPDTFQVKDLSVFELLKNFKDAFDSGNATWVSKNVQYIDKARGLTTKNNAVISFEGTQAKTLIENNNTKSSKYQLMKSDLVNADMAELATEFNTLLNTYQAMLSTLARMQSVSILNYLK